MKPRTFNEKKFEKLMVRGEDEFKDIKKTKSPTDDDGREENRLRRKEKKNIRFGCFCPILFWAFAIKSLGRNKCME